jgi:hypothetical protein
MSSKNKLVLHESQSALPYILDDQELYHSNYSYLNSTKGKAIGKLTLQMELEILRQKPVDILDFLVNEFFSPNNTSNLKNKINSYIPNFF